MTKLRLLLAAGLLIGTTGLVAAETDPATARPAARLAGTPDLGDPSREYWWTGEPKFGPKRKALARKTPTESLVLPIDPSTGEVVATGRLIVKFRDDLGVVAGATPMPMPVSTNGSDLSEVEQIMAWSGSTMSRWINRSPDELAALTARAEAYSGRPQPDLASIVFIDPPSGALVEVARAMNELDLTDWVEFELPTEPAQCDPGNMVVCNAPNPGCTCTVVQVLASPDCEGVDPAQINCADPCAGAVIYQGCNPQPGGNNPVYGCQDAACCAFVSSLLPGCGDPDSGQGWDTYCAAIANIYCDGSVYDPFENPSLGDRYDACFYQALDANGNPNEFTQPPFANPNFASLIPSLSADCFSSHAFGGCNQPQCCNTVCTIDPSCCTTEWDSFCVQLAEANPADCQTSAQVALSPDATATEDPLDPSLTSGRQAYTRLSPVILPGAPLPPPNTPGKELIPTGYRGGGFDLAGLRDLATTYSTAYQGGATPLLNGRTIRVGVLDSSAYLNHEDFVLATPTEPDGSGGTPLDQPKVIAEADQTIVLIPTTSNDPNHGTAALGVIAAADNGFGVTGIAHEAETWFFPTVSVEEGQRRQNALTSALETFEAGDVICCPIVLPFGTGGNCGLGISTDPLVTSPGLWTLFRLATDLGITSFVAAGNDSAQIAPEAGEIRSGAIVVGAGWAGFQTQNPSIYPGSNYGRRNNSNWSSREDELAVVDCQGWGASIATTGGPEPFFIGQTADGTPPLERDKLRTYTQTFGSSSGATAMVAGAAACLQGWARQIFGVAVAPETLGAFLRRDDLNFRQANFPPLPGNDLCPAAGDLLIGDGAETPHIIGPFPNLVQIAGAMLTDVSWPSDVDGYRVRTGIEVSQVSSFRLSAADGIAVEILTERGRAGQTVAGLTYLAGGWMTDIEVIGRYTGNLDELVGLQVTDRAATSGATVLRMVYALNRNTRRYVYVGADVMGQQYQDDNFVLFPWYDPADFVDSNTGEVVVRIYTAGLGVGTDHFVYHDYVEIGPNLFNPVP